MHSWTLWVCLGHLFSPFYVTYSPVKWDPNREDSYFFRQSSVLHSAFYWAQMQVHGQFLHPQLGQRNSPPQQPASPSLFICSNAARCCVRIVEIQQRFHIRFPIIFMVSLHNVFFWAFWAFTTRLQRSPVQLYSISKLHDENIPRTWAMTCKKYLFASRLFQHMRKSEDIPFR